MNATLTKEELLNRIEYAEELIAQGEDYLNELYTNPDSVVACALMGVSRDDAIADTKTMIARYERKIEHYKTLLREYETN